MNLALEATHYSEEGLPRGKGQKFSTGAGVVSSENLRKAVIEEEAIYLPASSCIPELATEQKIKHPALPNMTGKWLILRASRAEKVGMQDAIKMINNPEEQCLAASWGRQAGEHSSCLSLALQRLLIRHRCGLHDSARLIRTEKKGNWEAYFQDVGVSLSHWMHESPSSHR